MIAKFIKEFGDMAIAVLAAGFVLLMSITVADNTAETVDTQIEQTNIEDSTAWVVYDAASSDGEIDGDVVDNLTDQIDSLSDQIDLLSDDLDTALDDAEPIDFAITACTGVVISSYNADYNPTTKEVTINFNCTFDEIDMSDGIDLFTIPDKYIPNTQVFTAGEFTSSGTCKINVNLDGSVHARSYSSDSYSASNVGATITYVLD